MKVLICEDNPAMRQMIRLTVAPVADDICESEDGALACSLYGQMRPDWVLMDIEMGAVNGLVATRQIKARYPEARIVNAGGSNLTYDASSDTYTYIWKTDKAWKGTCRQFVLGLKDGSTRLPTSDSDNLTPAVKFKSPGSAMLLACRLTRSRLEACAPRVHPFAPPSRARPASAST
jgi:CheY-like chemotaxis protein